MVNFGPLTAEIRWRVSGTAANFTWFCVLAALLHGTLANCAALNTGCHLYSTGRPSRWALAHILVVNNISDEACGDGLQPLPITVPSNAVSRRYLDSLNLEADLG